MRRAAPRRTGGEGGREGGNIFQSGISMNLKLSGSTICVTVSSYLLTDRPPNVCTARPNGRRIPRRPRARVCTFRRYMYVYLLSARDKMARARAHARRAVRRVKVRGERAEEKIARWVLKISAARWCSSFKLQARCWLREHSLGNVRPARARCKHWWKYKRRTKAREETARAEAVAYKNRRMRGMDSPPPPRPPSLRRDAPGDAGSATQWRADALDFVASFLRLVLVLSSFL